MIEGVGIDVIEVDRIKKVYEKYKDRFLKKVYTEKEINFCCNRKNMFLMLASRFAAKEAFMKALGRGFLGGISWKEIEIIDTELSRPSIKLYRRPQVLNGDAKIFLSITHINEIAIAVVIRER